MGCWEACDLASVSGLIWAERARWVGVTVVCVQVSCVFIHVHVSPSQAKVENPTATVCWERASVLKKAIDAVEAFSRNIAVVSASLDIKKQNDPLLESKFKELATLQEALQTQVKVAYKLHAQGRDIKMDAAPEDAKELLAKIDATIDLLGHHRTGWEHSRKRFNAYIAEC